MKIRIILTLSVLSILYWFAFDFLRWVQFDTPSFIGGSRLLFGLEGGYDFQSRISKPLSLILPGLLEKTTGVHPLYGFIFQNLMCFFACGFLIYKIMLMIYKSEKIAFSSMLAYSTCQVFAIFSLFVLTDITGWFFGILSIYLTLNYIIKEENNNKLILSGFISGIGVFAKESAITGIIFLCIVILFSKNDIKGKIKRWTLSLIGFILPFLAIFIIIELFFQNSIYKRILDAQDYYGFVYYKLSDFKQVFRTLDLFWFVLLLGLPKIWKVLRSNQIHNKESLIMKSTLVAFIFTFLIMPVHPFIVDRIMFMTAPFLIILMGYGIKKFQPYGYHIIITGGILSLTVSWLIYKYNYSNLLLVSSVIYILFLIIVIPEISKNIKKNN